MKTIKAELIRKRKRRMHKRLQDSSNVDNCKPVISGGNVRYELASKAGGTAYGGMAAIVAFAKKIRLPDRIDTALHIFKKHQPFHESDHVLNFAYNALCGGTCLQDMERRRNDEFFLDAIGAERIPDPTTAGDFCRRFSAYHIQRLQEAFDEVRLNVWKEQDQAFFAQATIDMDGTIVQTTGQCKAGMDICYKGMWGYHPLVLTLAETGEVLRLVNRSGNQRCDQENILAQLNQCRAWHAPVDNLESNWAFHGNDASKLELESMDSTEHSSHRTLGELAQTRTQRCVANGIQEFHRAVRSLTCASYTQRTSDHDSLVELD